jgi:uncharacterized protein (DUF2141 family)
MLTQIRGKMIFEFSDIKPGNYAIAIHDENRNGELDTNMFGIPKEGYGSSGKGHNECPSFSDAVFSYDGDICKCLYLFTIKFNTQLFFPNKVL